MGRFEALLVSPHVVGKPPQRTLLALTAVGLLALASGGFAVGLNAGPSLWWVPPTLGIAVVAGLVGAGLVPTVGSLWLIGLWWFVFPPLVGYLTGNWAETTRYNHPRMTGYGYTSARAELLGGIEYGVRFGLLFAVGCGLVGYAVGVAVGRIAERASASE